MLCLKRKEGEEIVVGDDLVKIKVLKIESGVVSIGIAAPQDLPIWRREILDRIRAGLGKKRRPKRDRI